MSIQDLLIPTPPSKPWADIYVNNLSANKISLQNQSYTNRSGPPIPVPGFTTLSVPLTSLNDLQGTDITYDPVNILFNVNPGYYNISAYAAILGATGGTSPVQCVLSITQTGNLIINQQALVIDNSTFNSFLSTSGNAFFKTSGTLTISVSNQQSNDVKYMSCGVTILKVG